MIRAVLIACSAMPLIAVLLPAVATAQVHGNGPSDPNLFDVVFNLPEDQFLLTGSIGNTNGDPSPTTQLNVADGTIIYFFDAFSGSEVNISGGSVGHRFNANSGSEVNISGGDVEERFDANSGSIVNITGGTVGDFLAAKTGSEVNISSGNVGMSFHSQSGSVVNITGGTIGHGLSTSGVLNISGGSLDGSIETRSQSEVNISGGKIGHGFQVLGGSVNISGGTFGTGQNYYDGYTFAAVPDSGSQVNISGGRFGSLDRSFVAQGAVNISGGSFGREFIAYGDDVQLIGGEFKLNGVDFSRSTITLNSYNVFTGTLADGSSFLFTDMANDILDGVRLTEVALPPLNSTPLLVNSDISATAPSGLRDGQEMTLLAGGKLGDYFAVVDATLNVVDGVIGRNLETARGVVNISGGSVGEHFEAYDTVVNISGGRVGARLDANAGSVVNISGGSVGASFDANKGSVVNISGGSVGAGFDANKGSVVSLFGTDFFLDGEVIGASLPDEPFTIIERAGQTLSGTLFDGSAFSFNLNPNRPGPEDFFSSNALVTITLVTPGNFDLDSDVDGGDFLTWQRNPGIGELADWQANYDGLGVGSTLAPSSLPEPSTAFLAIVVAVTFAGTSRRCSDQR